MGIILLVIALSASILFLFLYSFYISLIIKMYYCLKHYITVITSSWSSFASTYAHSRDTGASGGGNGGTPRSSNHYYNSDNKKTRRNNRIIAWLQDCHREGEIATSVANHPLKVLTYSYRTNGPNYGPNYK